VEPRHLKKGIGGNDKMKELLGEELYNQVKEKIGDKELIINDGTYIPKAKFDDLNNGKKDLKKQLEEANTKIESLSKVNTDDLQKEIDDWKTKYETDTNALNDKISKREREYIINDLTRDLKFSSNSAKKSFMEDLASKDLKIEDGKMLGFDDYLTSYKEQDAGAFVEEKKDEGKDISLGDNHNEGTSNDDSFERKVMGLD
jgi:predicted phage tail protein